MKDTIYKLNNWVSGECLQSTLHSDDTLIVLLNDEDFFLQMSQNWSMLI